MQSSELTKTDEVEERVEPSQVLSSSERRFLFFRYSSRPRLFAVLAILVVVLLGWRLAADRDYWHNAWAQQSLLPQRMSSQIGSRHLGQVQGLTPFDLSKVTVPTDEILSGGPRKDGIPSLTNPKFTAASKATYLRPEDRVIGLSTSNQAKAYPLKILNYHEIVNDRIADLPVAVAYCPLCDSCTVFDRRSELGEREFGVSGLLYNSNVLMYDRSENIESLWSQLMMQGISGLGAKESLVALPLELTTWSDWVSRYPNTQVLSSDTGHQRTYTHSPYKDYFSTPRLMFSVKLTSDRLPPKSRVLGVWTDSAVKAYPESYFGKDRQRVEDTLDGKKIVIEFNPEAKSLRVVEADQGVHWMYSLWFAWYAFNPETDVHSR